MSAVVEEICSEVDGVAVLGRSGSGCEGREEFASSWEQGS